MLPFVDIELNILCLINEILPELPEADNCVFFASR